MKGIAYGVGVGPGDPELLTLKAVRVIRENKIIVVPGIRPEESIAYKIAIQVVPEITEKELVSVEMPMVKDKELVFEAHEKAAASLKQYLDRGENIVYLTLGDPTIYSTFSYIQRILLKEGYSVEVVNGICSFCAAAAKLNLPLGEGNEQIFIAPASYILKEGKGKSENYILMKATKNAKEIKTVLNKQNYSVNVISDCGMETEQVYYSDSEIPEELSYFTLMIGKEKSLDE